MVPVAANDLGGMGRGRITVVAALRSGRLGMHWLTRLLGLESPPGGRLHAAEVVLRGQPSGAGLAAGLAAAFVIAATLYRGQLRRPITKVAVWLVLLRGGALALLVT